MYTERRWRFRNGFCYRLQSTTALFFVDQEYLQMYQEFGSRRYATQNRTKE